MSDQRTLNADIIAKEALAILDNELSWLGRIHRAHESEYSQTVNGYKIGEEISIRRPADFIIRSGPTMNLQDVIEGKVTFRVDQQKGVDFSFSSTDLTLKIEDLSERVIKPAMINLINDVAADVLRNAYLPTYNWVGTPGQTISSFAAFNKVVIRMNEMAIPIDSRLAILSPEDHGEFVSAQTGLFVSDVARAALRNGELGVINSCDTYMSQVVPTHSTGTRDNSTPLVNGASQVVTYATAKDTWSQDLVTDGWDNNATIKAGDVFSIADVYMVNPKTKESTGILQQFVVLEDKTADGSGNATLKISPPIITSGPHQTVNAAPGNDKTITVVGDASKSYRQNLFMHKNAMALAVVPMAMPEGAVNGSRRTRKGLSVRVIPVYDGVNDVSKWRLDILYGRKLIDPRLSVRASGTASS